MPKSIILHPHEARAAAAGTLGLIVRLAADAEIADDCQLHIDVEGKLHKAKNNGLLMPVYYKNTGKTVKSPFGPPGTKLWAKETWSQFAARPLPVMEMPDNAVIHYKTDFLDGSDKAGVDEEGDPYPAIKWKSPATMPEWASRLTLTVGETRVKRVQDVTVSGSWKCGFNNYNEFREFTESKHPGAWRRNDWVWVASVEVGRND